MALLAREECPREEGGERERERVAELFSPDGSAYHFRRFLCRAAGKT